MPSVAHTNPGLPEITHPSRPSMHSMHNHPGQRHFFFFIINSTLDPSVSIKKIFFYQITAEAFLLGKQSMNEAGLCEGGKIGRRIISTRLLHIENKSKMDFSWWEPREGRGNSAETAANFRGNEKKSTPCGIELDSIEMDRVISHQWPTTTERKGRQQRAQFGRVSNCHCWVSGPGEGRRQNFFFFVCHESE
ncbi:hypothetical protein BC940DRAFT_60603 [Gongronella butleri]|nr:hypothetical protein BC940DRAFT_60603 [Gongronella butleri]